MPSDEDNSSNTSLIQNQPSSTAFRSSFRRRLSFRRRRLPTVRLGGGKKPRKKGFFLVRILKRIKLKSLKLKYLRMLNKFKDYYDSLLKDMIDGAATIDSFQQRALWDASFAVPAMGFTLGSLPPHYSYVG